MAKYRKRAELGSVYVPGVGRVTDDRVLDGDYAKFVPALLVEVADVPAPAVKAVKPPPEATVVMTLDKQAELVAASVAPEAVAPEATKAMSAADLADLQSSEKAAAQQRSASKKSKK